MTPRNWLHRPATLHKLGAVFIMLTACAGRVPAFVDVEYMPPDYASYPSYVYDGTTVYWIEGRWYRRHNGHWAYYRDEPSALRDYRQHHFRAPPARSHTRDRHHFRAPPARSHTRDRHHFRAPPTPHDDRDHRRHAHDHDQRH